MNIPKFSEELQESPPQLQRAQAVLAFLGERTPEARLSVPEGEADPIVRPQLGDRALEFNRDTVKYDCEEEDAGGIAYGDDNWEVHCYGLFAPNELQAAADYLLNPDTPPPSITAAVTEITGGLIAGGISKDCIIVEWPGRVDQPVIKQSGQPNRELRFGLFSPGTINAYENGKDQGLTYCNGAVRFLQGLWYNEGEWDDKYEKRPDGNYGI